VLTLVVLNVIVALLFYGYSVATGMWTDRPPTPS
jgi:hypothetical protein